MADLPKPDNTLDTTPSVATRAGGAPGRAAYDAPQAGDKLGRYLLSHELGAGGMGVVMAAYDPKVDRKVALKLLRSGSDIAVQRLLREARALAMLTHPSVITVFEVGEVDGQHYISMEYVEGVTLRRWLAEKRPPWRRILGVLLQAGRGLAAAHEAGLVHRDVKPGNVLVSSQDRTRVVDFGIAAPKALGHSGESMMLSGDPDATPGDPSDATVLDGLTQVGQVVGTPAYMSPEQHRGETVDARCDQFSFCVMAFECLFSRRPFHGTTLQAIARCKFEGEIEPLPKDTLVPASVRDAILRGLSAKADERWPSMTELLAHLEPRAKARPLLWAGGIGFGVLGLASFAVFGREDPKARCDAGAAEIETSWNDGRAQGLEQAFRATELVYAEDAAERIGGWLDRYAERWRSKHAELCQAVHVDATLPEADFDLEMACLKRRFSEFDAMVEVLVHADKEIVREGIQAAAALRPVADCENIGALRNEGGSGDWAAEQGWEPYAQRLSRAEAMGEAGKFSDGLTEAEALFAELATLNPSPPERLSLRAALAVGRLAAKAADFNRAEVVLTSAYHQAVESGHDRLAAETAGQLSYVVGYRLARFDDGLRWSRHAEAAAERGGLDSLSRATIRSNVASIYFARGDYDDAAAGLEEALRLRSELLEADHPQVAVSLFNLGGFRVQEGKFSQAKPLVDRALKIWEVQLGQEHPLVASALVLLAQIHEGQEEYSQAVPLLQRALKIREAEHGAQHPDVAAALDALASVLLSDGQYEDAEQVARRGLDIRRSVLPDPHPHRAASLTNLGMALAKLGRADEAKQALSAATEMWGRTVGEDHPHAAFSMTALGEVLVDEGEFAQAVVVLEKAAMIRAAQSVLPEQRDETRLLLEQARAGLPPPTLPLDPG